MTNDNEIPYDPLLTRELIDIEFEVAVETFGEDHIEIKAIAASWGDTMNNEQVLKALRMLNETGSYRADDE